MLSFFSVLGLFLASHNRKKTSKESPPPTLKPGSRVTSQKHKSGDELWTQRQRFKSRFATAVVSRFFTRAWFSTGLVMRSHRAVLNVQFHRLAEPESAHRATQGNNASSWRLIRKRRALNTVREICGLSQRMVRPLLTGTSLTSATTLPSPKSSKRMVIDRVKRSFGAHTISAMSHPMPLETQPRAASKFHFYPNSVHHYRIRSVDRKAARTGELAANSRFAKSPAKQDYDSQNRYRNSTPVELKASGDQQMIQWNLWFIHRVHVRTFTVLSLMQRLNLSLNFSC